MADNTASSDGTEATPKSAMADSITPQVTAPDGSKVDIDPARAALVKRWIKTVKADRDHPATKKAFDRIQTSMQIAAQGAEEKTWIDSDMYVVPIINRHINQAVSALYARNPKAVASPKTKLLYQLWDGDPASLQAAMQSVAAAAQAAPTMDPATGAIMPPPPPDPQAMALIQEVEAAKQQLLMYNRLAKTMEILFAHYLDEQDNGYKEQIKAMVRRAKVCGVAYVKLGFQRQLKKDPDIEARIADATDQIARIEALLIECTSDDFDMQSAKCEELRLLQRDLQGKVEIIVREGPVLSFPKAREIIVDKRCRHLKTLAGARHIAHEFHMTSDEVMETYGIDLKKGQFTPYKPDGASAGDDELVCVWEIQDKMANQTLTVCDGYPDFLKEPAEPDVKIERFWTIFPLVLNEIESEEEIYPPSDAWNARHPQREYNSARQGLREHRVSSRPRYAVVRGKLEEKDKERLANSAAHEVIELNALLPNEDINKVMQRVPAANIDPNLYETDTVFSDVQRSVGSQEANIGGVSGATATETSIAENSRMSASSDNSDDLDTLLTQVARAMGQLMLLELSIDTVREIAGPGAVWPTMTPSRESIVKDLVLDVEAGSSGRPNKAAKLADFERAAPWMVQLPGVNPIPFVKKGLDLLDIDLEDGIAEGMPSIVALNAMAGKPAPGAAPNQPGAQGGQGGDNTQKPPGNEAKSQPAYPGPATPPA